MRPLAITSALTALAAAVGSKGTDPQSDWYESLDQPAGQPPPIAFPLVTREVAKHDKTAAAALTPYVVWTGFATALNAELWRRNR